MADETTATGTAAVVTVTATTETDAVIEVVIATKNAIVKGVVTVNATVVTPEGAIGSKKRVHQRNRPV